MEWKDYADFTATDFLADDFFMEWVLRPNAENRLFWEEWQQHYPEKRPLIDEARAIMLSLEYHRHKLPAESYDRIWNALQAKLEERGSVYAPEEEAVALRPKPYWRRAAAWAGVCSLLAIGGYLLLRPAKKQELYTSQFGENRRLVLPDSSVVILGPHSVLKAVNVRPGGGPREVWLEGEAYFMVKNHPVTAQPFTVHAGELDIEVLGTEFNVNNYNGNPRIVLHSGKVALRNVQGTAQRIVLEPGDMVEYRAGQDSYIRKKVAPEKYSAWVNNTLVFDRASLDEVAAELRHRYGVKLQFADSSLVQEEFSATLQQASVDVVIRALQEAFNMKVERRGDSTFVLDREN